MSTQNIISEYLASAMSQADFDKVEDGTFSGRIPCCKGVIAFADNLRECSDLLRATLEDWLLVGLKLGHALPVNLPMVSTVPTHGKSANQFVSALVGCAVPEYLVPPCPSIRG